MAPRPGTEILQLLMPMSSGSVDGYGKDVVPPVPLSFDRVNEGRSPRTTAQLFQLPFELLGMILRYIHAESLPALTLVNTDCLQLARSRQFASICLDYSDASLALVAELRSESQTKTADQQVNSVPSLGACIRRMTVATDPGWIYNRHGVCLGEGDWNEISEHEQDQRMVNVSEAYFGQYLPTIKAIFNHSINPNLELLDWEDKVPLTQSFFNSLALSSVRYLKLFRVSVDDQSSMELTAASQSYNWPLQTLHLEMGPSLESMDHLSTSPLAASVLRMCSSSLVTLFIQSITDQIGYTFLDDQNRGLPEFPSLRNLTVGMLRLRDTSMLQALVPNSLRTLDVDQPMSSEETDFFQNRGCIRSLEAFSCPSYLATQPFPGFLHSNSQILKLAFTRPLPNNWLESRILPPLSESFSNLKSLSLVWDKKEIPESAIETISSFKTLEQIQLSAGTQAGWRHNWPIKHDMMRKHISLLLFLKKVAFSRDSYVRHPTVPIDHYYELRWLLGEEMLDDLNEREVMWERNHRERMVSEAFKYVKVIPDLEWLYFGQTPMHIERSCVNGAKLVVLPHRQRDDCWTLLRKMFGGTTD